MGKDDKELGYRILLKPTGGLWLFLSDRTMIDIDMDAMEMRSLAHDLLARAGRVEAMRPDLQVPRPAASERLS